MKDKITSLMLLALVLTIGGVARGNARGIAPERVRLRERAEVRSAVRLNRENRTYVRMASRSAELRQARLERDLPRSELAEDFDRCAVALVPLTVRKEKEKIASGHHNHRYGKAERDQEAVV